jgi:protein-disulfide isomerase
LTLSRRPALLAAAALAAIGLVLAAVLARQHAQAHAGVASFCAINEYVNCDRVATSRYSVVLGLPVAAWGMLGYGLALLLAVAGLRPGRRREGWPAGLLFLVAAVASAAAVALALVSELAIGALCLLCAASWLTSFALLAAAWRACRPDGVGAAVRGDLAVLRARPLLAAGLAAVAAIGVALGAAAYPRYWERSARTPKPDLAAPGTSPGSPGESAAVTQGPPGPIVVVEFSDYECPFCAKAHEDTKQLLSTRPDVTLVRRHFPLDSACNPMVKRRMHPEACDLARAAICAEEQGKLPAMDDALFRNQQAKRPTEEVAAVVGLDLAAFRRCLASPATDARLLSDVEAGARVGLTATPTYVVAGRAYTGRLPPELLPPPRAAAADPHR